MMIDSALERKKKNLTAYILVLVFIVILLNMLLINENKAFIDQEIASLNTEFETDLYLDFLFLSNNNLAYLYNDSVADTSTTRRYFMLFTNFPNLSYLYNYQDGAVVTFSSEVFPLIQNTKVNKGSGETIMEDFSNGVVGDIDYNSEMFYETYNEDTELEVAPAASFSVESTYYTPEQLNNYDFLVNNLYTVDSKINVSSDDFDIKYFLTHSMQVDTSHDKPSILIYHTHSQEAYVNNSSNEVKTVVDIGDELTRILEEEYGINVYHLRKEYDIINGVLDRSKAYELIQPDLEQILEENPTIELMIDVHRDGIPENIRLVTEIDGKPTAKVMFFNGLSKVMQNGEMVEVDYMINPYVKDNMALSLQMQLKAKELYDGFTRKIYLKGYRYNLHFLPKSMLIEVGAQNNTYEEAFNAMAPLAKVLYEVIK